MEDAGRPPYERSKKNRAKKAQLGQISADWWVAWRDGTGCPDGDTDCPACAIAYATKLAEEAKPCLGPDHGAIG